MIYSAFDKETRENIMEREMILVLDFGGQYNQLIARRVREANVYCEVHSYTMTLDEIKKMAPKGIILTGGPNSVYALESPSYEKGLFELGIPVLGICYGSQLMAHVLLSANTAKQKSISTTQSHFSIRFPTAQFAG